MVHMTVHCTRCGTATEADIIPEPPTDRVHGCSACLPQNGSSTEFHNQYTIHVTIEDDEGPLTRLSGTFEAPTLSEALDNGALAAALEPMWNQLQKTAHLAEDLPPPPAPEEIQ